MNETDKQILTVGQRAVFTALLQTASITEASKNVRDWAQNYLQIFRSTRISEGFEQGQI